jgi:hypothetical protein
MQDALKQSSINLKLHSKFICDKAIPFFFFVKRQVRLLKQNENEARLTPPGPLV